jgi:hypothetical protein
MLSIAWTIHTVIKVHSGEYLITLQHTQEALTFAYIHALSGVAGLNIQLGSRHDYGIDGTLRAVKARGRRLVDTGVIVDFQLKATVNWAAKGADIVYDLEAKNYNDLVTREPDEAPFILILLCMPKDTAAWLTAIEDCLTLRNCCYWLALTGAPSANIATKRIHIPKANLLTPTAMQGILADAKVKMLGA